MDIDKLIDNHKEHIINAGVSLGLLKLINNYSDNDIALFSIFVVSDFIRKHYLEGKPIV
jgi:hypothetical protein